MKQAHETGSILNESRPLPVADLLHISAQHRGYWTSELTPFLVNVGGVSHDQKLETAIVTGSNIFQSNQHLYRFWFPGNQHYLWFD